MKVEIKIDGQCKETTVTIVAKDLTEEVSELAKKLQAQDSHFSAGSKQGTIVLLDIQNITRIFANKQKVIAMTDARISSGLEGQEYTLKHRLYELEDRLPAKQFVRISHSEIINLKKVRSFDLSLAGSIQVFFNDNTATFVSRRYVSKVKKALGL